MKIRVLLTLIFVVFASLMFSEEQIILKSATEYNYPPFSVIDNGIADGFSVELLKSVVKVFDMKIEFKIDSWDTIKNDLKDGKLNVLPLVGRTPERENYFDFTFPYIILHGNIFIRTNEKNIKSENDLYGKKIFVMKGDNAHEYAVRKNLSEYITPTETYDEAFKLLSSGRGDAVLANNFVGAEIMDRYRIHNVKALTKLREDGVSSIRVDLKDFEQKFCFAVKKGDAELLDKLNEGLAIVYGNGEYQRLYEKWFPNLIEKKLRVKIIVTLLISILIPIIAILIMSYMIVLRKQVKVKTASLTTEISERIKYENELNKKNDEYLSLNEELNQTLEELEESNEELINTNDKLEELALNFQKSEESLRMTLTETRQGLWEWNLITNKIIYDGDWIKLMGYDGQSIDFDLDWWGSVTHPDSTALFKRSYEAYINKEKEFFELKYQFKSGDGKWKWLWARGKFIEYDKSGNPIKMIGTQKDITDEKLVEEKISLFQYQVMSLWNLAKHISSPIEEICSFILEDMIVQAASLYGFFGFISPDQQTMTIYSWSKEAMKDCGLTNKPIVYNMKDSGLWAEAVRRKEAIIINDYSAPHEKKLGMPNGHVPIKRFMAIPVIIDDKVVSIGAVANKSEEYDDDDMIRLETFLINAQIVIDRKISDEKLLNSLKEKEILLKEVHHRVKNNMQIVSSIIGIQIFSEKDSRIIKILEDVKSRIKTIALIHEKLYRSNNFAQINMPEFLRNYRKEILSVYSESANIDIIIAGEELFLPLDIAIPCSMIINELVTNCFKYAFPENSGGIIEIKSGLKDGVYELSVKDNGVGLTKEIDLVKPKSIGLEIVTSLVYQIMGKIKYIVNNGTEFIINFNYSEKNND